MSTPPANLAHPFDFSTCLAPSQESDDDRTGARSENARLANAQVLAGVVPNRVPIDPSRRMRTPTSRRLRYALPGAKTFLVTSLIVANFAAYFVIESSPPATDHLASLPELASRETRPVTPPSLPQAVPPSTEFRGITAGSGTERETQTVSLQPTASLQFSSPEEDKVPKSSSSDFAISDEKHDLKIPGRPHLKIPGRPQMVAKRRASTHTPFKRASLKNEDSPACSGFQCSIYSVLFGVGF
jgi:hypothetical protein